MFCPVPTTPNTSPPESPLQYGRSDLSSPNRNRGNVVNDNEENSVSGDEESDVNNNPANDDIPIYSEHEVLKLQNDLQKTAGKRTKHFT